MAKNKIDIASLDIDVERLIKNATKTAGAIQELKQQQEQLRKKGEEASKQFVENAATLKNLEGIYKTQQATLSVQIGENEKLLSQKKNIKQAVEQQNDSENGYIQNNKQLIELKKQLRVSDEDYEKRLAKINEKISENNYWLKENGSANANLMTTMSDFKTQITDSFDAINIFNGGISGFVTRAQEAGGVGPLIKNSFNGMAEGIGGMTKSALTFIATPLGAIIAALGIALKAVSSYFTDTQEGMDKLNAITVPLKEVMSTLMGIFSQLGKVLVDTFSNPQKALEDFATMLKDNIVNRFTGLLELIPNLGKAIGLLLEGNFSGAAKVATDAVGKVALGTENITDKVANATKKTAEFLAQTGAAATEAWERGQKIDALQKNLDKGLADYTKNTSNLSLELDRQSGIADDTNASFAQRQAAAIAAVAIQKQQNKLVLERLDQEIALFKLKSSGNDAELAELVEMEAKRKETAARQINDEEGLQNKLTGIRRQAMDAAIKKQHELLDLFVAQNPTQEKTLEERLDFEKQYASKSQALLKQELDAKKITRTQYETEMLKLQHSTAAKLAEVAADSMQSELNLWQQQNKSYTADAEKLTETLIKKEAERIDSIWKKNISLVEAKTGLDKETVLKKQQLNQTLTQKETDFLTQLLQLDDTYKAQKDANNKLWEDEKKTEDAKKIAQNADYLATELEIKRTNAATEFELQRIDEAERHATRLKDLDAQLLAKKITQDQYALLLKQENKKNDDEEKKTDQAVINNKLTLTNQALGNLTQLLGKNSAAGKAAAIAQTTIDTYLAAQKAYTSQLIAGDPTSPVRGAIAAASAVASGLANVKKITSTKTPKVEKGALFNIGGQRHSAGGTLFTGADGTQFEAEQGELIGVMNRNAARHFMAFNNAFPAGGGSAPNYFASGGIVSREVAGQGINVDELAAKIATANASLPAPVVAVQDIVNQGNSYVRIRDGANF